MASLFNTIVITDGTSGAVNELTVRVRGIVQLSRYTGGSNDGAFLQVGGSQHASDVGVPVVRLDVTSPSQTYYLNRTSVAPGVYLTALDYYAKIKVLSGATLTVAIVYPNTFAVQTDVGGGTPELPLEGITATRLRMAKEYVIVEYLSDVSGAVTESTGGVVRDFVFTGYEEQMYGVKAEK